MGISQQIGASSLIKPGVIDNTAARPASPYEGQVIFQKDTDQLLVWNGTAWVIPNSPAQNPGGLDLITNGALSGTTTNFVGCFTSAYRNYRIVIDTLIFNVNYSLYYRMLQSSTALTASNYQYAWSGLRVSGAVVTAAGTGENKGYLGIDNVGDSNSYATLQFDVYNPTGTQRTTILGSSISYSSGFFTMNGFNLYNATGSGAVHDGIQFFGDGSTVTMTGNVSIYGYRNS